MVQVSGALFIAVTFSPSLRQVVCVGILRTRGNHMWASKSEKLGGISTSPIVRPWNSGRTVLVDFSIPGISELNDKSSERSLPRNK